MSREVPIRSTIVLQNFLGNPGNEMAYRDFVEKYRPRMLAACRRRGVQDADAEDLTAGLLLKFHEKGHYRRFVFQGKGMFNGWLAAAVRNAVAEFRRIQGRRPDMKSAGDPGAQERFEQLADDWARDVESICADDLAMGESARRLVESRVGADTMRAFHMQVIEGRKAREVADSLSLSLAAVYQAKHRVVELLRAEFAALQSRGQPADDVGERHGK